MSSWASAEISGARLWDGRCSRSLIEICDRLSACPGLSLSSALGPRLRQCAHRITSNERVDIDGLLAGHRSETAQRCSNHSLVLAVQDTTEVDYTSHKAKTGLGPLTSVRNRGLLAHSVMAVHPSGLPLGVLGVSIWSRDPDQVGKRKTRNHRPTDQKESKKWIDGLRITEQAIGPDQQVLLIQDREADVFAFLATPRRTSTHLLIRACHPRLVEIAGQPSAIKLTEAIVQAPVLGTFQVTVPRKPDEPERTAILALQLIKVKLLPPSNQLPGEPNEPQTAWVLRATETAVDNKQAIDWVLISTLEVNDLAFGSQLVEFYTRRWMIERLHYTLKSGCQVERLQVDDAHTLGNALALYYIVAWRLLYVTHLARTEPDTPAEAVLTRTEILVLSNLSKQKVTTVQTAVGAIAKAGGYSAYRGAKPPGVKVIWTGLRQIQAMAQGWDMAKNDQSYESR